MPSRPAAPAILIRDAQDADMPAIAALYAHHVLYGTASFEVEPPDLAQMRQRRQAVTAGKMPYLVAAEAGRILGYAYVTPYRPRPAYAYTVEDSVYLLPDAAGQGIGSLLLAALIERCSAGPWRQMIANVGDSQNLGSLRLHAKFGFRTVGTCENVGYKFGRWLDAVLMQRSLGAGAGTPPFSPCGNSADTAAASPVAAS
jgi:L-amino acid N-acyltransferase YncA